MSSAKRERLKQLFLERAVAFGEFTLASGRKSPYYINSKKVLFHAEAISLLADLILEQTQDLDFVAIGGLEVGAIPMAAVVAMRFHQAGKTIEGFFVRKQTKDHGSKERIEGQINPGDKVVVIDDVLTTGESVIQAIEAVEAKGAIVVRVISIVDRLAGAKERLAKYDYQPLFTITDLGLQPV
jgi:orotate phosphoribosyltransferase